MEIQIIELFEDTGMYAVLLSILLSIVISILGIVPSIFLTVANIGFFGFCYGLFLSILGEALGAIIGFYLFRKGLNKVTNKVTNKVSVNNKVLNKLQETEGLKAFTLVLALRLAPFIPSGLITLVSAGSKIGILNFSIASTLGKIPALIIEAYSIKEILDWDWQGKIILAILSIFIFILMFRKKRPLDVKA